MFSCPKVPAAVLGLFAILMIGGTAGAAPIFSQATLNPDAISPNGDDVREFTVIQYTVAVDSADVRVLLATAGGAVTDTLQIFTRQGQGLHSLVFDGTGRSGPVPDGNYEVRVVGVGTLGEGTETATLPLLIDRVAPEILSWDLVSPAGPGLQDGDTVTLQACFGEDPDTVRVDLSALDSGFDPGAIGVTILPALCRRYAYTITAGNTVPDGDNLPAVITAIDRAGNRSSGILPLCISNQPPSVTGAELLNAIPYLQNGDEIQTQVTFQAPDGVTPGADFSNLDSGFDPNAVTVTSLGGSRYGISYRISDNNTRPDGDYALHLLGRDAGCGVARDSSLTVTLDNAGVNVTLISNLSINHAAFSPGGDDGTRVKSVNIRFTVLEDSVTVAVVAPAALLKNPESTEQIFISQGFRIYNRGTYTVPWDGSGPPGPASRLKDQILTIRVRGISSDQDRQRNLEAPLEVDNTDPILTAFPAPGSLEFRNGKLAVLPVTYDRPGYTVTADFDSVDSGFDPGNVVVTDESGGNYRIFYTLRPTNTRPDAADYPVPLSAVDLAGNVSEPVDVIHACLNNTPPQFVSAELGDLGPFTNGSVIQLTTTWESEPTQSDLQVTADFSALDDTFDPESPPTAISRGDGVYEISYTIGSGNTLTGGSQLPIYVTASDNPDEGCGSTTVEARRVDLDNTPAPQPTLTASAVTIRGTVVALSGNAPEAVQVQILRGGSPVDTFQVGENNLYSGQAALLPGQNRFAAKSIDAVGHVSPVSRTVEVFSVEGTTVTVPPRFAPGDEFFVAVLDPASRVTIRIFNLDGIEIARLEETTAAAVHQVAWDGRDQTGNLASSGPCLAVIEITDTGGTVRERVKKAFIFTRRGPDNG